MKIKNNQADDDGGALYIWSNSNITFIEDSTAIISGNRADDGGAFYIQMNLNINFIINLITEPLKWLLGLNGLIVKETL